jgi:TPR repeat protein
MKSRVGIILGCCALTLGWLDQSRAQSVVSDPAADAADAAAPVKWLPKDGGADGFGDLMFIDSDIPPDDYIAKAARFKSLLPLAESGDAESQAHIGIMYRSGRGVQQDCLEAIRWLKMAGEQGHVGAANELALTYFLGCEGIPRDNAEGVNWTRKAAEEGDKTAQRNLGDYYANALYVPCDYGEAAKWYRKAADQGDLSAEGALGDLYARGLGLPQSYSDAVLWYSEAAGQGNAEAEFALGNLYANGLGVGKDHVEAARWYREAAERGNQSAQSQLGELYENGLGVPQDYAESVRWYVKSAEQGDPIGQFQLGLAYAQGHGVPQNYEQAYKWFSLAASRIPESISEQDFANIRALTIGNRDKAAAFMTKTQIADAQRLAREWTQKRPSPEEMSKWGVPIQGMLPRFKF